MNAQAVFNHYSPAVQAQFRQAWARSEALAIRVATDNAPSKKPKVFEVHHAVEHARKTFLEEMAKGLPADLCERAVSNLYPGYV